MKAGPDGSEEVKNWQKKVNLMLVEVAYSSALQVKRLITKGSCLRKNAGPQTGPLKLEKLLSADPIPSL